MTPVAIYARFSTDKQDARSIGDQLRRCREFAARHGYEVIAEFSDAAISGAHTERPEFRRMLDVATATKRPPFKAVIVDDLSRLSRDLGDTWRIVFSDLASVDVKVIDASTGMASDASGARITFAAMAMVNDQFLQMVKHETHRGLTGRALAGFSTGGSQYGYRTVSEDNPTDPEHPRKRWVIYEPEAEIVRRIFREYDQGAASYKSIAERLNAEHVPAPRDGRKGHKIGVGWNHTSVRAILHNRKYIGEWSWNETKWVRVPGRATRRQLRRPESERIVRTYPELAIIDREQWDRVAARLKRQHRQHRPPGVSKYPYLVSGLLRCGECGGPMSIIGARVKNGIRYATFGCSANRSRGSAVCSMSLTISDKKITEAIRAKLRELLTDPMVTGLVVAAFREGVKAGAGKRKHAELERKVREAEARVRNITAAIARVSASDALLDQLQAEESTLRQLRAQLAQTPQAKPLTVPSEDIIRQAVGRFLDDVLTSHVERGRELLARVLHGNRITVSPKENGPGRYLVASGAVDLTTVLSYSGSGGVKVALPKAIPPVPFSIGFPRAA